MRAFTGGVLDTAPSDSETAEAMGRLCEVFLAGIAARNLSLGWDGKDVALLDDVCDQRFIPGQPTVTTRQALSARMGAYVGELLVRNAGGHWVYDVSCQSAAVELPDGRRVFPAARVAQRIAAGRERAIAAFYRETVASTLLSTLLSQAD
jgi:hypothetical protein